MQKSNYYKSIKLSELSSIIHICDNHLIRLFKSATNRTPINYINENSVPTIICHGTKDDVVPFTNAVILEEILTKNKVENELIIFEGSGHGLENNNETLEYAKNKIKEYVKKYLN